MSTFIRQVCAAVFAALAFAPSFAQAPPPAPPKVAQVLVRMEVEGEPIPPELIARMEESLRAVTEKVLLDKTLAEAEAIREDARDTIRKVLDRVITGFYVRDIVIEVGETTRVTGYAVPSDQVVRSVRVELEVANIHAFWQPLLSEKAERILPQIKPQLQGIPVEAQDWAVDAVQSTLQARQALADIFVGFDVDFTLEFAEEAVVRLRLKPKPPVVEQVVVRVVSDDLPNGLRAFVKNQLVPQSGILQGMPVRFLHLSRPFLLNYLQEYVLGERKELFGITVIPTMEAGRKTVVLIRMESKRLYAFGDGHINIGLSQPNPEARGSLWYRYHGDQHVGLRAIFEPHRLALDWQIGLLYRTRPDLNLGWLLELETGRDLQWVRFDNRRWQVEAVGELEKGRGEASIGYYYRPHIRVDFVSRHRLGTYGRVSIRL